MIEASNADINLKTLHSTMLKGFDRMEKKFDVLDQKIDSVRLELKADIVALSQDIDDLAGMTAREFKAVRSDIAHKDLILGV